MSTTPEDLISSRKSVKRRLHDIDETIEGLHTGIDELKDFAIKVDLQHDLLCAKLKRQKLSVLAALANSQILVAEMEMLTAENELRLDLAKMKRNSKINMDLLSEKRQEPATEELQSSAEPVETHTSQNANGSTKVHSKKKKSSSSQRKSSSQDVTLIVDTPEPNPYFPTQSTQESRKRSPSIISEFSVTSERSISSSIASEFNRPYPNDTSKKTHESKKSSSKRKRHSKSEDISKLKTKTVAQINKDNLVSQSNFKKINLLTLPKTQQPTSNKSPVRSSTPIRHTMPAIFIQPNQTTSSNNNRQTSLASKSTVIPSSGSQTASQISHISLSYPTHTITSENYQIYNNSAKNQQVLPNLPNTPNYRLEFM